MKRKHPRGTACAFALALVSMALGAVPSPAQNQSVPVAIVNFQDDSGANASLQLRQRLAQELQQKLLSGYKDVLPRLVSTDVDSAAQSLTVVQLTELGKQNGARFVVRGGILSAVSEPMAEKTGLTVQLYVEVISVDTASVVTTLRAEGAATQSDAAARLSEVDPQSEPYRNSAFNLAFHAAIARVADSIHQAVTAPPVATAVETDPAAEKTATAESDPTEAGAASVAEADTDLLQLIAQAESILSAGANASTESITALSHSLETLKSALATKASLMEGNQDTAQADQDIAAANNALEAAVSVVAAELGSSVETSTAAAEEQPSEQKKGLLASIDEAASQALSILQKIQEIRTALQGSDESSASEGTEQSEVAVTPAEEPVSEASGIVVDDNGNPVEGAEVTDQQSGATAVTDSSGVYQLKGLLSGKMAHLIVRRGQTSTVSQVEIWPGRPAVMDFRLKPPSAAGKTSFVGVMPSTVFLSSTNNSAVGKGRVEGVVHDAQGKPVPRALVTLKGLGLARTNSQGQYKFINVPVGAHQVVVVNPIGLKPGTTQVQVTSGSVTSTRVQFSAGHPVAKPSAGRSLILPASGTMFKGTVVAEENRPVGGAKVVVVQENSAVSVFTGPKGTFQIRSLKPGSYRVVVSRAGYEGAGMNVTLRANASEDRGFRLKKQSSPVVASVLRNDAARRVRIRGLVRAPNGRPVPGATVHLKPIGVSMPAISAKTNAVGEYSLNVREGQYAARVSQASYREESRSLTARAGASTQANFSLQPLAESLGQPSRAQQPLSTGNRSSATKTGQLSGRVTDGRTGKPVAGAVIAIQGFPSIRTDHQGNYSLPGIANGDYHARVSNGGYSEQSKKITVRTGSLTREDFALMPHVRQEIRAPRAVVPVQITRTGGISGQVTDAKTRKPIAGATISISGQRTLSSDSAGRVTMANLSPGTYQITAGKSGYTSGNRTVLVRSGETAAFSVTLTPMVRVPARPR